MKLCVIGAGGAGLCAVKNAIEFGCEVTAFEQTRDVGGTWVYTDEVGKDRNGLDVHSSMYEGLRTNLPKEIMGYPSVPFPDHEDSYIPSEEVYKYYQTYADRFDLRKHIRFEHHVLRVRPLLDETWEIIVEDMATRAHRVHIFDAVLVCNGHYSTPNLPRLKGQKDFKGKQIHSHDYRSAEKFLNESVLVIGAGPSGTDCVIDISKVARAVTWSHHLQTNPVTHFAGNVNERPDVSEITETGVLFVDGSYQDYSVIFYATGYKYTFPFLSVDCGVKCENNYISPLFKHCLSINQPTLGLIGLTNYICPNQMFDLQVRFCLTFMSKRREFPSKRDMLKDLSDDEKTREERGISKSRPHYIGVEFQDDYYADLARVAGIESIKPVISRIFKKGLCNLLHDSAGFRNEVFKVLDDENFVIIKKEP